MLAADVASIYEEPLHPYATSPNQDGLHTLNVFTHTCRSLVLWFI